MILNRKRSMNHSRKVKYLASKSPDKYTKILNIDPRGTQDHKDTK